MKLTAFVLSAALSSQAALAASPAQITAMSEALKLDEIVEIMRDEGLSSAGDIAEAFGIRQGAAWQAELEAIYDADRMHEIVLAGMSAALEDADPTPISAFYTTELGARIIDLELSARVAFADESVEEASNETAASLPQDNPERFEQLRDFIEVNNLIESNVIGALNSNFAFMDALNAEGGLGDRLTESQILNEVYGQEQEIRVETGRWLYSYLNLAYQPLSADEMDLYLDFSQSEHGQAMNRALFEGFDDMFVEQSRALGSLVGQYSIGEEL